MPKAMELLSVHRRVVVAGCNAEVAHDLGEGETKVGFADVKGDTDHVPLTRHAPMRMMLLPP